VEDRYDEAISAGSETFRCTGNRSRHRGSWRMRNTALYKAVQRGDVIEVRRLLLDGADPNQAPNNNCPLVAAVSRGYTPIIRALLDSGAKPNWLASRVAAFRNHHEAVQLLLAAGAPVDDEDGGLPLLNELKYSGIPLERQRHVRQLLRDSGGREVPEFYLRWRMSFRVLRWRLRRLLY
jgi:hypothetical protein